MPLLPEKMFDYLRSFATYADYCDACQPMVAEVLTERTLPDGRVVKGIERVPVDPAVLDRHLATIPDVDELARKDLGLFVQNAKERGADMSVDQVRDVIRIAVENALARRAAVAAGVKGKFVHTFSDGMQAELTAQLLENDSVGHALKAMGLGSRRKGTVLEKDVEAEQPEQPAKG